MSIRHDLTLQQKIELINDNRNGNGLSQRTLAVKYNISLGSVSNVLKCKAEYLDDYGANQNHNVKRKIIHVNSRELGEKVYEWFVQQRSKNIPISGPILQEKAREVAESLGGKMGSFKASNDCGESLSVDITIVDDWVQRIPKIIDDYDPKDIFNCDETGLFFKFMPDKSLTLNRDQCKGGKKSKERYTILFCVNSTGEEKLKPLVIAKSLKPRCFKNLNVSKLPINWRANKTAWLNVKLFSEWLSDLNVSMKKQKSKIILFLDSAPYHPVDIELSNIKLQYFPPNTTSKLQPLDQGIIHAFKTHYRKRLVKYIIARCTTAQTPDDIKITHLNAIYWIDAAWKAVTHTTIRNTFRVAGFKDKQHDDITTATSNDTETSSTDSTKSTDDEPYKDLKKLDDLLEYATIGGQTMNAADFVDIDNDTLAYNEWFDQCEQLVLCDIKGQDDDYDDDGQILTESPPKLTEAMEMIRKLHLLAITQQPQLHQLINEVESKLTDVYINSKTKRQTTLEDFFKQN
ncbi:unnamed protein product [Rotaria magnacalcarata]|uniref:HTH CENPB-type domain-containing protein n=1 Tax=Rotaria magnacalcarata TaxID=392030 RepID=A0A816AHY1_9BILA|nr:unnamed protein product [Rotaria magnacalcarata]CAF1605429.1 unnamed protein product [Rotaria magnacalcarata]CAF4086776.1 unnamed protein product [Rotaria magnacalcarata]CAF4131828.1 unnamed protein product [Rotaria magnacalcarata]